MRDRLPFFYGWLLVAVAFVEGAFGTGIAVWGFGVFVAPMEHDLGWSRSTFFLALSIRSLLGGFLGPFVGAWQDRGDGPRRLMLIGYLLMGCSLIGVRWVQTPWQFYLVYGGLGALALMGGGNMVASVILPKWFIRQRGRVIAIASSGNGTGAFIFPTLTGVLVGAVGWRDAWLVLGVLVLVIMLPLACFVRTRPEDLGLLPDGDPAPATAVHRAGHAPASRAPARDYTAGETLRTRAFWLLMGSAGIAGLGVGGLHSNLIPYFKQTGLATASANLAISLYSVCSIAARLLWGACADRFAIRHVLALQSVLTALSIVVLLLVSNPWLAFLFAALHGLSMGGFFILRPLVVADYFGRAHLGAINGVMRPVNTLSGALSPLLIAGLYDLRGSYHLAWLMAIAAWLVAAVLVFGARAPRNTATRHAPTTEPASSTS